MCRWAFCQFGWRALVASMMAYALIFSAIACAPMLRGDQVGDRLAALLSAPLYVVGDLVIAGRERQVSDPP
jgi:hypothetical protein